MNEIRLTCEHVNVLHVNASCHTYMNESCHTWMSLVAYIIDSCHTQDSCMSQSWHIMVSLYMRQSYMCEWYHTCEWVMSHMWDASCHARYMHLYICGSCRIWASHVTACRTWVSHVGNATHACMCSMYVAWLDAFVCVDTWCIRMCWWLDVHNVVWVMPRHVVTYIFMNYVTRIIYWCFTQSIYLWHDPHVCIIDVDHTNESCHMFGDKRV